MTRERRRAAAALAAFIIGAGLMIPFELVYTRIVGVASLLVAIVLGVFAIVSPAWLAEEGEADAASGIRDHH